MSSRNFGRVGNRVLVELLLIEQKKNANSDYSVNAFISLRDGLGLALLTPYFLFEISFFTSYSSTYYYYQNEV
jgi:hypothetical protein